VAWAKEISPEVSVSLMAQYYPTHHGRALSLALSRGITEGEYLEAIELLEELGIGNGWIQEMSAPEKLPARF